MTTKTVNYPKTGNALPEPELLDAHYLHALYGVPVATWRYWAHVGRGPESFKIGRRRVWRRSVVEAWIAEREAGAK